MRFKGVAPLAVVLALGAVSACGSSGASGGASSACEQQVAVDRFHQLEIVDDSLLQSQSSNGTQQPWSFAAQIEKARGQVDASSFLGNWLESWDTTQSVAQLSLAAREKAQTKLICPWLTQTTTNACNADCSVCAARDFDETKAPFRLIAVANRVDLGVTQPWTPLGELRLVYALTDGPGDDPASPGLDFSVAFEYVPPTSSGPLSTYAKRWTQLPSSDDPGYLTALQSIVSEVTGDAANLAQVRTNELELDWTWQFREYHLANSALGIATTRNNPLQQLNDSPDLQAFLNDTRPDILAGKMDIPSAMLGPGGGVVQWVLPEPDGTLRQAFARQTCSGCHGTEEPVVDVNFQISPRQSGVAKLSTFLNNETDPSQDELSRRSLVLAQVSCGSFD